MSKSYLSFDLHLSLFRNILDKFHTKNVIKGGASGIIPTFPTFLLRKWVTLSERETHLQIWKLLVYTYLISSKLISSQSNYESDWAAMEIFAGIFITKMQGFI